MFVANTANRCVEVYSHADGLHLRTAGACAGAAASQQAQGGAVLLLAAGHFFVLAEIETLLVPMLL